MTKEDKQALRDLFASQALVGLAARNNIDVSSIKGKKYIATRSYEIADEMLKAREQNDS